MLRLHDYRRCPFCIRVRIVLHLKAIQCEIIPERLRNWSDWMLAWAKTNKTRPRVPVLENTQEGWALAESNQINLWLDTLASSQASLTPADPRTVQKMNAWWQWCDERFKPAIDLYKYGKNRSFDIALVPEYEVALNALLDDLEGSLIKRSYLLGDTITLADIAIIPFIRQLMRTREGAFSFSGYPSIVTWASTILDAQWFNERVMKK